jgi:hypothetical protein
MKIYLTSSGKLGGRASQALSNALHTLIPTVKVWLSSSDIIAGAPWMEQITRAMKGSDLALVCITSESRSSP